jgi:hydroxymethylpyrimidine kinase/phosphomethylpyrimidine kinase
LTFQNADGFFGATHESAESLCAQIVPVIEGTSIAAVKTGMLPTAELVSAVADLVRQKRLPPPVLDPVLKSSSGYGLMEDDAIEALTRELIPLVRLLTPNVPEAEVLSGLAIEDEKGMRAAAAKLREMGARAVLIKGGHLGERSTGHQAIDVLNDNGAVNVFGDEWIDAPPVRGSGCMMSSAIAAWLARGLAMQEAVRRAKEHVAAVIRRQQSHLINQT